MQKLGSLNFLMWAKDTRTKVNITIVTIIFTSLNSNIKSMGQVLWRVPTKWLPVECKDLLPESRGNTPPKVKYYLTTQDIPIWTGDSKQTCEYLARLI